MPAVDLNDLTKAPARRSPARRARRMPAARKPKLKPKPKPARELAPTQEQALIKSPVPSAAKPPAAAPADDGGFLLPGVPRRVPPQSVTKPQPGATPPAAAAEDGAEDGTTKQVREQFVFCSQLLAQGAYGDHFDTCLCSEARQAAPYRGRRSDYAKALKKAAAAGALETSAAITGIVLDGAVAKVTAAWKSGASGKTRTATEDWRLEDGLWCRDP